MAKEQKTMKLLIELDEDYYHKIMTIKPVHYTARVYIAIQNGTRSFATLDELKQIREEIVSLETFEDNSHVRHGFRVAKNLCLDILNRNITKLEKTDGNDKTTKTGY